MPVKDNKEYIQGALDWVDLARIAGNARSSWDRYQTAEWLAKKGGADIYVTLSYTCWPPYQLAKRYLELVLKCLEQKGDDS